MRILLCKSILKNEVSPLLKYFSRGDIKKYVNKVKKGLGTEIKGSTIPGTKIVKVYMTGTSTAGRMIVLIYVQKQYYLPVIVRLKKDKIVGRNLSTKNESFQELLEKNLEAVQQDLQNRDFEELE